MFLRSSVRREAWWISLTVIKCFYSQKIDRLGTGKISKYRLCTERGTRTNPGDMMSVTLIFLRIIQAEIQEDRHFAVC